MQFFLRSPDGATLCVEFSAEDVASAILSEEAEGAPYGTRLVSLETDRVHAIASDGGWTITASWAF